MFKLCYIINGRILESFILPNIQLCSWKKKQLVNSHKLGMFKIVKI